MSESKNKSKSGLPRLAIASLVILAVLALIVVGLVSMIGGDGDPEEQETLPAPTYQEGSGASDGGGGTAQGEAPAPWKSDVPAAFAPGDAHGVFETIRNALLDTEKSGDEIADEFGAVMTPTLAWTFRGTDLSVFREQKMVVTDVRYTSTSDGARILARGTVGDSTTEVELFRVSMMETLEDDHATGQQVSAGYVAQAIDLGGTVQTRAEGDVLPISSSQLDTLQRDAKYAVLQIVDPKRDSLSEDEMRAALGDYFHDPAQATKIEPLELDGQPVSVTEPESSVWVTPPGQQPELLVGGTYMDSNDFSRADSYSYYVTVGRDDSGTLVLWDAREVDLGNDGDYDE